MTPVITRRAAAVTVDTVVKVRIVQLKMRIVAMKALEVAHAVA